MSELRCSARERMRLAKRSTVALTLVICALASAAGTEAHAVPARSYSWCGFGLGAAYPSAVGGVLSFARESRNRVWMGCIGGGGVLMAEPFVTEFAALYGLTYRRWWTMSSVAAGVSIVSGQGWGEYRTRWSVGVPVEAQFSLLPLRCVGLSVGLHANINPILTIVIGTLGIKVGNLR